MAEKKERKRREIETLFDEYMQWIEDTITTEDNPFIQVIAVLSGEMRFWTVPNPQFIQDDIELAVDPGFQFFCFCIGLFIGKFDHPPADGLILFHE